MASLTKETEMNEATKAFEKIMEEAAKQAAAERARAEWEKQ
jgi:hypothetical protein